MGISGASFKDVARSMREAKKAKEKGRMAGGFAVFLGAGASRSAGIPTAAEMAEELALRFYQEDEGEEAPEDQAELWRWV